MRIKITVSNGLLGCDISREIEIDDEEALGKDGKLDHRFITEYAQEEIWQMISWDWEEVADD